MVTGQRFCQSICTASLIEGGRSSDVTVTCYLLYILRTPGGLVFLVRSMSVIGTGLFVGRSVDPDRSDARDFVRSKAGGRVGEIVVDGARQRV